MRDEFHFAAEGCWISEWWNDASDAAVSIARARVEPGITTAWHRLIGTTERYVILEGRGRVEIGQTSARKVVPGDVVLISPDMPQRIANIGTGDLVFLAICTPCFRTDAYVGLDSPGD